MSKYKSKNKGINEISIKIKKKFMFMYKKSK